MYINSTGDTTRRDVVEEDAQFLNQKPTHTPALTADWLSASSASEREREDSDSEKG